MSEEKGILSINSKTIMAQLDVLDEQVVNHIRRTESLPRTPRNISDVASSSSPRDSQSRKEEKTQLSATSQNFVPQTFQKPAGEPVAKLKQPKQISTVSGFTSPYDTVYQVQFKLAFRYYEPSSSLRCEYNIGDFVIVVSDHGGEDLGIVSGVTTRGEVQLTNKIGIILHMATQWDRDQLKDRFHDEHIIFQHCVAFQQNASNLKPLSIVDVEYQFDRTKVFVHYATTMRVDYRELVRSVQAICRCHVKMMRVNDKQAFQPHRFAQVALQTGELYL